jgi:hypothetical protein
MTAQSHLGQLGRDNPFRYLTTEVHKSVLYSNTVLQGIYSVMYQSRLFIYLEEQLLGQTYWGEFSSRAIDGALLLCHLSAEQTCDEQTHYIPWWSDLNLLLNSEQCWIELNWDIRCTHMPGKIKAPSWWWAQSTIAKDVRVSRIQKLQFDSSTVKIADHFVNVWK